MMKKVCIVVSSMLTVKAFLADHIRALAERYEVSVVANTAGEYFGEIDIGDVVILDVPIVRPINPLRDIQALLLLYRLFRKKHFDVVHSVTPKAGLLAAIAGQLAGIPVRVHTFTGQVWVGRQGLIRHLLKAMDRLLAACASHILVDSFSQREFLIDAGVVSREKSAVLANGSICGVDRRRFRPDPVARKDVRREFEIGETDSLLLYLGRLNRDKGLLDLTRAFVEVANCQPDTHLLLVGPDEGGIRGEIASLSQAFRDRVHFKDFTDAPERYMAAADLFCLPSYREGFGSVIIEAAACGVPAVASRIYGITDAVINGQTGVLHPKGDVAALRNALLLLLSDPDLRETMGRNAALRATAEFDQEIVTAAMVNFFDQIAAI